MAFKGQNHEGLIKSLQVSRETIASLNIYEALLLENNRKFNLISKSTENILKTRHILDSAQAIDFIDKSSKICADLGTGAGFPGIVLSILFKERKYPIRVDLYEKSPKKCQFLSKVVKKLDLKCKKPDLKDWNRVMQADLNPKGEVNISMVGKYMDLVDAYKSLNEALVHGGIQQELRVNINYVDSELLESSDVQETLGKTDAILVPGGFGERGIEGMIIAAEYARKEKIPYLGICLGMQVAVIEYARNILGLKNAHSSEFDKESSHPVIGLIHEWIDTDGSVEKRDENSNLGGTMRLGGQQCLLSPGSLTSSLYGENIILERHRHRYEVNNNYAQKLKTGGMDIVGRSEDKNLVEVVELKNHPWYVGCQFHPEFTSNPREGHPLFIGFIKAAEEFQNKRINKN